MAGGIDWFRWHHGSVTDPKFHIEATNPLMRTASRIETLQMRQST